jgi:large subunit ribosomal protein L5
MLKDTINTTIKDDLIKLIGKDKNVFSLPKLMKVVINYRVAEARESKESLDAAIEEITSITGQKPQLCKAKKAVANFKLRQNDPLALKVTLRGNRMYDFVEKLFNIILPRFRDFKGMKINAFDDAGNYNLTVKDQTLFPEINLDKVSKIRSTQVTLNIHATSKDEAKMLLSALGFPFEKPETN